MPTGRCQFPEHHSPSAGPPLGLLAAIALGALVIAFWHAVIVALVVVAILAAAAGMVFLLIHNHGSGYDPELERQAAAERTQLARTAAGAAISEQSPAMLYPPRRDALEAPPVMHQHLHLHGVSVDDMAEVARQFTRPPHEAIEEGGQSW